MAQQEAPSPFQGSQRPLFGGAIEAIVPNDFRDASEDREISDNQEVFVHLKTDRSFIVEILQLVEDVTDDDALRFHFDHVATLNKCPAKPEVVTLRQVAKHDLKHLGEEDVHASVLGGTQVVSKFRESDDAANLVQISMGLLRLKRCETDLLVTLNSPLHISPESSSSLCSPATPTSGIDETAVEFLQEVLQNLRIADWNLFGDGPVDD
mmetsp:Transcript_58611/g.138020  ORF Transcript_58611/g.138020 Transcript_58611/m.138020 type:complete len:209 (+) Transcript_58611:13-639(+)